MEIEAAVLTGGASRRMGRDKAALTIAGEPLALRIARALSGVGLPVTVLGKAPIAGFDFLPDVEEHAGPAVALSRFEPRFPWVFVASCDLPRFDPRIVGLLASLVERADAAVPVSDGRPQPLCGLYRAQAIATLREGVRSGSRSIMAWLDRLAVRTATAEDLLSAGLDPECVRGVNTPEEWERAIRAETASERKPGNGSRSGAS